MFHFAQKVAPARPGPKFSFQFLGTVAFRRAPVVTDASVRFKHELRASSPQRALPGGFGLGLQSSSKTAAPCVVLRRAESLGLLR